MAKSMFTPSPPPESSDAEKPLIQKIGWFILLALGGVAVVATTAYTLRGLLLLNI